MAVFTYCTPRIALAILVGVPLLLKAYYPEKMIQVDVSCCAGVTPQSHENAVSAMKMCQIDIIGEQNKKGEV